MTERRTAPVLGFRGSTAMEADLDQAEGLAAALELIFEPDDMDRHSIVRAAGTTLSELLYDTLKRLHADFEVLYHAGVLPHSGGEA